LQSPPARTEWVSSFLDFWTLGARLKVKSGLLVCFRAPFIFIRFSHVCDFWAWPPT
jgi:hypothetical protein